MSLTKIPEFGVSLDPDQIVKIDLVREIVKRAENDRLEHNTSEH